MSKPDLPVPDDQAAAAAQALRDLDQVPGDNPVVQLERLVTVLFAHSTELLAKVAEAKEAGGSLDVTALERLERTYEQCLTAIAPLVAGARVADPAGAATRAPATGPTTEGRGGGCGYDWQGRAATGPVSLWETA